MFFFTLIIVLLLRLNIASLELILVDNAFHFGNVGNLLLDCWVPRHKTIDKLITSRIRNVTLMKVHRFRTSISSSNPRQLCDLFIEIMIVMSLFFYSVQHS